MDSYRSPWATPYPDDYFLIKPEDVASAAKAKQIEDEEDAEMLLLLSSLDNGYKYDKII